MSYRPPSRREWMALRKRLSELMVAEIARRNSYRSEYPGVHIARIELGEADTAAIRTARKLEYAVVLQHDLNRTFNVFAVPLEVKKCDSTR